MGDNILIVELGTVTKYLTLGMVRGYAAACFKNLVQVPTNKDLTVLRNMINNTGGASLIT